MNITDFHALVLLAYTQATTHSSLEIADQHGHLPWWISDNFSCLNLKCCKIRSFYLVGLFSLWFIFIRNEWILALPQTTFQNVPHTGQWSCAVWTFPWMISLACRSASARLEAPGRHWIEATLRTSDDGPAWGLHGLGSHIQESRGGFHKKVMCKALCLLSWYHFDSHFQKPRYNPRRDHSTWMTHWSRVTCHRHFSFPLLKSSWYHHK